MGAVLIFTGHHFRRCTDPACRGCVYCMGGLAACSVCGGAEAALPTDCPGHMMDDTLIEEVVAGRLNFTRAKGWHQVYPRLAWSRPTIRDMLEWDMLDNCLDEDA